MNKALKDMLDKESESSIGNVLDATIDYGYYSSGFAFIDACVSPLGLFPIGALTEVMGAKATAKTTVVLHAIAEAIRANPTNPPVILWNDFENQLHHMRDYALALGVDITAPNFIHRRPTTLEEGCQFILDAIRTGGINFVVIDSNAAMRPKVELDKGMGEVHQKGVRGAAISEFCRNLTSDMSEIAKHGIAPPAVIIINHIYQKLNIGMPTKVPIYDSPGSESIKFYASLRLQLTYKGAEVRQLKNPFTHEIEKIRTCSFIELFVEKCKTSIPHKKVTFAIRYGEGIDPIMSFMKAAINCKIIKKLGNSPRLIYLLSDGTESQSYAGVFALYDFLRDNFDVLFDLAKHQVLSLWAPILKSRLPMVTYAKSIIKNDITLDATDAAFEASPDSTEDPLAISDL